MILQSSEIVFVSADFPGFSSAGRTFGGQNWRRAIFLKKFLNTPADRGKSGLHFRVFKSLLAIFQKAETEVQSAAK